MLTMVEQTKRLEVVLQGGGSLIVRCTLSHLSTQALAVTHALSLVVLIMRQAMQYTRSSEVWPEDLQEDPTGLSCCQR